MGYLAGASECWRPLSHAHEPQLLHQMHLDCPALSQPPCGNVHMLIIKTIRCLASGIHIMAYVKVFPSARKACSGSLIGPSAPLHNIICLQKTHASKAHAQLSSAILLKNIHRNHEVCVTPFVTLEKCESMLRLRFGVPACVASKMHPIVFLQEHCMPFHARIHKKS
jgi:hypothetical protein